MGMSVGSGGRRVVAEVNVVPLIDILLVLLVIFMLIPHSQGMLAQIPQPSTETTPSAPQPEIVVVQVLNDGTLRVNQEPVQWENLVNRLQEVFRLRISGDRSAFIRGENLVEFGVVARVIDAMHTAGIASVGLLTQDLGQGQ